MRSTALAAVLALGCARPEAGAVVDSGVATKTPAAETTASVPRRYLAYEDFAGTWHRVLRDLDSDSVLSRGTMTCASDVCRVTIAGLSDTLGAYLLVMGDSAQIALGPYRDPLLRGLSASDVFVAHLAGGTLRGTGVFRPANRPDSVVLRYRFEARRVP